MSHLHYYFLQLVILIMIVFIQLAKQKKNINHKNWYGVKIVFNFFIFKIYLINILSESRIIKQYTYHLYPSLQTNQYYLQQTEQTIFCLSLILFVAVLFIILFLKNAQTHNANNQLILILPIVLYSVSQVVLLHLPIIIFIYYHQIQYSINPYQLIQKTYIIFLLFLSAITSMEPILKMLILQPILKFIEASKDFQKPKLRNLKYQYVQLKRNEFFDAFNSQEYDVDYSSNNESIIEFDDEDHNEQNSQEKGFSKFKKDITLLLFDYLNWLKKLMYLVYTFFQMFFALVVIFGFVCIIIEVMYPSANILSSLNAVDFFQSDTQAVDTKMSRGLESLVILLFKFLFIILLYFSSQNLIVYTNSNQLLNRVNSLLVIIKKSLLNFSLIALLTSLYPGLTFTINNSDCYREISFRSGEFYQMSDGKQMLYDWENNECPITIIGLVTLKVFEGNGAKMVGLSVVMLYIIYSVMIIVRFVSKREEFHKKK